MLIERFTFSKEMIDKFNDYIHKLTEIPYITAEYRKGYCRIELEADDNYDSIDLITGELKEFLYDYTDMHKINTNNRKLVMHMLDNQIKLIKKYSYERFAEKYILFKEFLEWLEDNHTGHSIYFREEVLCDETLVSQFEITFSDVLDYKSIVHYISDENKERLKRK